jgi:DNA-binding MarR family transcriptional regulator
VPTYQKELDGLTRALQTLREDDNEMPVHRAGMLLDIALQPGITIAELQKRYGFTQPATARNVAALSEWRKLGEAGLGLVAGVDDPAFANRKIYFLTPKGRKRVERALARATGRDDIKLEVPTPAEYVAAIHRDAE